MKNKVLPFLQKLASVRLTLTCLGLMMALVFFGTLAQVNIGTFAAQKEYFNQFFIYGTPLGFKIPIFPGGLTVGALWFINLVAAFCFQFRFVRRNTGILISHLGLIILLMGQFLTQTLANESQMPVEIGHSRSYTEAPREAELAFTMTSDPDTDEVTTIPLARFKHPGVIEAPALPFKIVIKKFYANSNLSMGTGASLATQGIGTRVMVDEIPPVSSDEEVNVVSIYFEALVGDKSLGTWLASSMLGAPQSLRVDGKEYAFAVRPRRHYLPFTIHLKEFRHDLYPGTQIPKNFSSRIHLTDHDTGESRDALIYMNNPLRYRGKTFYQASFAKNDTVSIFQVVENPAWVTPYISCIMVVVGLAIQFLWHLLGFVRKRA